MNRLERQLPTPWQEVTTPWSQANGIRLLVKRDDLIHPLISGNKWRKLKGFVETYPGFDRLHTHGGAYSNHLIAAAAYAEKAGVQSKGFVRGERPRQLSTVLQRCLSLGMELEFISRSAYASQKHRSGTEAGTLWIPEGGSGPEGMLGCKAILSETEVHLDHCVVACGTGTTLAGIRLAAEGTDMQVLGVPVLKPGEFIRQEVKALTGLQVDLDLDHHLGGYARTSAELMQFIREFAEETGMLLDPIYTAKAFYAAMDRVIEGKIDRGSTLGLIHTGGLTGWYGKWPQMVRA